MFPQEQASVGPTQPLVPESLQEGAGGARANGTVAAVRRYVRNSPLLPYASSILHYLRPIHISETPHMEPHELEVFKELLQGTRVYLEYGGGGSTILAADHVAEIVSVDSDRRYISAIKKKIETIKSSNASDSWRYWAHRNLGQTRQKKSHQ